MDDRSFERASGELAFIRRLEALLEKPGEHEHFIGDDAAILDTSELESVLFSSDIIIEGIHFDRSISSTKDIGWKALAVNASDAAAMGASPWRCVVCVAGANSADLDVLYEGLLEATRTYGCPIVGGDVSDGDILVVSVALLATTKGNKAVMRSGAQRGDALFVTGPLGSSAAGLRPCVEAHRRPKARVHEGIAAARSGATAMIDVSDGLGIDLHRLAWASGVGFALESVPVAQGATKDDALGGGEDFELLFTAPDAEDVRAAFRASGLRTPIALGRATADEGVCTLLGAPFEALGYSHEIS
jgi:thiamine-monophosphate kinase